MNDTNREPEMTKQERIDEAKAQIEELQLWFARKPYGWRERATPEQLRQWADREREQDALVERIETLEAE
jgi:hypothetical protein